MNSIRICAGDSFTGEGKTRGLDRGLVLWRNGHNLAGEGMGIGCPAVHTGGGTVFASIHCTRDDGGCIVREYHMDRQMSWTLGGRPAPRLSAAIEAAVWIYRRAPPLQWFLVHSARRVHDLLHIRPAFPRTAPHATAVVTYRPSESLIAVSAVFRPGTTCTDRLFVFNELRGDVFCGKWDESGVSAPPPGWESLGTHIPTPWISDRTGSTRFRLREICVTPTLPWEVFWGRERTPDLCWAGFTIEIATARTVAPEITVSFSIELQDDPGDWEA